MNIMIYINRTNEKKFGGEDNKSGLINQLLEEHYENHKGSSNMTEKDFRKANEGADDLVNPVVPKKWPELKDEPLQPIKHTPEQQKKVDSYFKPITYTRPEHTA